MGLVTLTRANDGISAKTLVVRGENVDAVSISINTTSKYVQVDVRFSSGEVSTVFVEDLKAGEAKADAILNKIRAVM